MVNIIIENYKKSKEQKYIVTLNEYQEVRSFEVNQEQEKVFNSLENKLYELKRLY